MTISAIVGNVEQTAAKVRFSCLSLDAVTAICSDGSVVVTQPIDRYNDSGVVVGAGYITITGLSAWSDYTYTISQGGESVSGSFKTMPEDKETDFGFIVSTCDFQKINTIVKPFRKIRALMESAQEPIVAMYHIDDIAYFDVWSQINDAETGVVNSGGEPQNTGIGRDYAAGYAAFYGLLPSYKKYQADDVRYVLRNLQYLCSGGDHAVCDNHCRGDVQEPATYHSCDRTVGGLEDTAKAEWDAFMGDCNPPVLRPDKWHWGKIIGCVNFALFDYSLYSEPYDSAAPDPDLIGYGSEQIADVFLYQDTNNEPFKFIFMESGFNYGQPWQNWQPNECEGWKTDFDSRDNLNGVDGVTTVVYGDNHSAHVISYDKFWAFSCGAMGSTSVLFNKTKLLTHPWASGRWLWEHSAIATKGDTLVNGFWYFRVLASQSPKKIEARYISGVNGSVMAGAYEITEDATNNQWSAKAFKRQ